MFKKIRWFDNAIVYLIVVVVLTFVGQIAGVFLTEFPIGFFAGVKAASSGLSTSEVVNNLPDALLTGIMYFEFIGIWVLGLLWMFLVKKNRPVLKAISHKVPGNNLRLLLLGIAIGAGMNGLCILGAFLNKDIYLYFEGFNPLPFFLVFLCVFVQSSAEELLCRGYLMQRLLHRYKNPWIAIIGNSLLFALLHIFNPGITPLAIVNILLVGVFLSLITYYLDSIWCAFAIHAAWNFTQNCVFGLPNSGNVMPYSVWKLDAGSATNSFAYNVAFGVEGTVLAAIVTLIGCVLVYLWGKSNKKTITNVWPE